MIKKYIFILYSVLLVFGLIDFFYDSLGNDGKQKRLNEGFRFELLGSKSEGWGYDIFNQNGLIIHQNTIPAVSGSRPFTSSKDAKKVALLVIEKLNEQKPPTVQKVELQALDIDIGE